MPPSFQTMVDLIALMTAGTALNDYWMISKPWWSWIWISSIWSASQAWQRFYEHTKAVTVYGGNRLFCWLSVSCWDISWPQKLCQTVNSTFFLKLQRSCSPGGFLSFPHFLHCLCETLNLLQYFDKNRRLIAHLKRAAQQIKLISLKNIK